MMLQARAEVSRLGEFESAVCFLEHQGVTEIDECEKFHSVSRCPRNPTGRRAIDDTHLCQRCG